MAPLAGPRASAHVPPPGCGSTFVPQVPDDLNLLRLRAVLGCPGGGSGFSWVCRALTPLSSRGCADSMWEQGQGWWGGSRAHSRWYVRNATFLRSIGSACQLPPETLLGQCFSQTSELRSSAASLCQGTARQHVFLVRPGSTRWLLCHVGMALRCCLCLLPFSRAPRELVRLKHTFSHVACTSMCKVIASWQICLWSLLNHTVV